MCWAIAGAITMAALKIKEISDQNELAAQTAKAANDNARAAYATADRREEQIRSQEQLQRFERYRQAQREEAKVRVAAGEAGVLGGVSPARSVINAWMQNGYDQGIISANADNQIEQTETEKQSIYAQAQSAINKAKASVTNPFFGTLQVGMSALSGYALGGKLDSMGGLSGMFSKTGTFFGNGLGNWGDLGGKMTKVSVPQGG